MGFRGGQYSVNAVMSCQVMKVTCSQAIRNPAAFYSHRPARGGGMPSSIGVLLHGPCRFQVASELEQKPTHNRNTDLLGFLDCGGDPHVAELFS